MLDLAAAVPVTVTLTVVLTVTVTATVKVIRQFCASGSTAAQAAPSASLCPSWGSPSPGVWRFCPHESGWKSEREKGEGKRSGGE